MNESAISKIVAYARKHLLLDERDVAYAYNKACKILGVSPCDKWLRACYVADVDNLTAREILLDALDDYIKSGLFSPAEKEDKYIQIMDVISLRPSEIDKRFAELEKSDGGNAAMKWLYSYVTANEGVRLSDMRKNIIIKGKLDSPIDININVCKEEKNLAFVINELRRTSNDYPACPICRANEGYGQNGQYKQNLRTVGVRLCGEEWFWQFSPYGYLDGHGVLVNCEHKPMAVDGKTVERLIEFVDRFDGFFIGCNAALAGVGGSILSHDHYQGGCESLPVHKMPVKCVYSEDGLSVGIVDWYASVVRLSGERQKVIDNCNRIISGWLKYTNEDLNIIARDIEEHNAVAPIVRKTADGYTADVFLRNNRANDEYPHGIFCAHEENRAVKSESVGLMESQGLFILPPRLKRDIMAISEFMAGKEINYDDLGGLERYKGIILKLIGRYGTNNTLDESFDYIASELEFVCTKILEDTAVFKSDESSQQAFKQFINDCVLGK